MGAQLVQTGTVVLVEELDIFYIGYKGVHKIMSCRTDFYFHPSEQLDRRFLIEFELNHVFRNVDYDMW